MSDAPSLDALAAAAREMLDGACTCPAHAAWSPACARPDCPRHGEHVPRAPDLARGLVAAVDALRAEREARATAERERDAYRADAHRLASANGRLVDEADAAQRGRRAAETARDALAAAVRDVGNLIAEHGCSCDCGCTHTTGEHTSACDPCLACRASDVVSPLLSGCAADVVRAGVVRDHLAALDLLTTTRADDTTPEMRGNAVAARAALDAALAAAEGRS